MTSQTGPGGNTAKDADRPSAPPPWMKDRFSTLKEFGAALAIVAVVLLGGWGVYSLVFSSSEPKMATTIQDEARSPDGQYRAVKLLRVALPAIVTAVTIAQQDQKIPLKGSIPFICAIDGRVPIRMKWESPRRLILSLPKNLSPDAIHRQLEKYQDIEIKTVFE
jgi:hypothetical protein